MGWDPASKKFAIPMHHHPHQSHQLPKMGNQMVDCLDESPLNGGVTLPPLLLVVFAP